ncbi:hypothetical protein [Staphylococcus massiliensis]|nr:hypothetical protein [Staphylococcus massiliensis]
MKQFVGVIPETNCRKEDIIMAGDIGKTIMDFFKWLGETIDKYTQK